MEGRFQKLRMKDNPFVSTNGIYCNNEHTDSLFELMQEKFGEPNALLSQKGSSLWKYIFKFESSYCTVYEYNGYWSVGFLEKTGQIPDYEFVTAVTTMLYDYLQGLLKERLLQVSEVTV